MMIFFQQIHPSRTTRRHHRQAFRIIFETLHKFGSFFNNRQVSTEVGVKNPVKAQTTQCRIGFSGKIFAKLGENGVNIRMITQGPEELNIIVGVEEKDFEQAIRVLYNSFVKENVV